MSDTPETDELSKGEHIAHPTVWSFCRKFERERDELRNALSLAGKLCHQVHHSKSMQHGAFEPCPVEALIQQALYKAQ